MVAAHHLGVDFGAGHLFHQPVGDKEVVDAPSRVFLPCLKAVAPPGIDAGGVRILRAEGVGEAGGQQLGHLLALLVGEAGVAAVGFGIFQVDLLVRHVHVATDDDRFLLIQRADVGAEVVLPLHPVVQARQGYGTKNYASKKQAKTEERADIYFDIYSLGKTMESLLKATDAVQKIIEKCLIDDDAKRYHNTRQIQADFERILRICRMKKGFMVVIAVFCIQNLCNQIQREEQREKEVIVQKKSQREIKKAMAYFYGTDQIQKNTQLARAYLERCRGMKKNVSSYLVLLDVLDDRRNDISAEKLMKIVQDCQTDVHDFWSAYFYLHFYTVNTAKLSENVWKEAEKMLEQIQKYPQKEEYQKLVEADRINLYEREAEKGDDRKFLEETDRVFKENLKGDPAWKLYERKLVYLESKQPDISREFERFLKKYPKVMDAYVEYSIYLCRNNKMTQAQRVYREGRKRTGMTSKRAEELRRKLGL